jgi:hypothetical protein
MPTGIYKRKPLTEKTKQKISQSHFGILQTPESKAKMSLARKGKHLSESHKQNIRKSLVGRVFTPEWCKHISEGQLGKHLSEATKKKISEHRKGKTAKEHHPQWLGGKSFEPYCIKFNDEFKERVRAFFGCCCVECGSPQTEEKLHVHHVNFNKNTCCDDSMPLFVALCRPCHTKTNHNRGYWENHFTQIIFGYYKGKSYLTMDEYKMLFGG